MTVKKKDQRLLSGKKRYILFDEERSDRHMLRSILASRGGFFAERTPFKLNDETRARMDLVFAGDTDITTGTIPPQIEIVLSQEDYEKARHEFVALQAEKRISILLIFERSRAIADRGIDSF